MLSGSFDEDQYFLSLGRFARFHYAMILEEKGARNLYCRGFVLKQDEGTAMTIIVHEGHTIQIQMSYLFGKERISYDGKEVSSKRSVTGSTHIFQVTEKGEEARYEVEIGLRWHGFSGWITVRRNGIVIFSNR